MPLLKKPLFSKPVDATDAVLAWARYSAKNNRNGTRPWLYTQGPERLDYLYKPFALRIKTDCSGACLSWASWAGVDIARLGGPGYTGTMLQAGKQIAQKDVRPGDFVFFGDGTADHVALVMEVHGQNILTLSHGQQGDPSWVWVNKPEGPLLPQNASVTAYDGRKPQRFMRYNLVANTVKFPPAS